MRTNSPDWLQWGPTLESGQGLGFAGKPLVDGAQRDDGMFLQLQAGAVIRTIAHEGMAFLI